MFIKCSGITPEYELYPGDDPMYINSDIVKGFYVTSGHAIRSDTAGFYTVAETKSGNFFRVTGFRKITSRSCREAAQSPNPRSEAAKDMMRLAQALQYGKAVYSDIVDADCEECFSHIFSHEE